MNRRESLFSFASSIFSSSEDQEKVQNVTTIRRKSLYKRKQSIDRKIRRTSLEVKESKENKDKEKWVDDLIDKFTVPNAKRHIDNDQGLLTNDESEFRIIVLLIALALIIWLSANYLCYKAIFMSAPKVVFRNLENTEISRCPHVFLIYQDGLYMDFSTDETLSPSKNFTFHLPKSVTKYSSHVLYWDDVSDEFTSYMGYADLENIYIFYGNGERVVTFINFQTQQLRTIPGSKLINKSHLGSGVQVGNLFLMAGDKESYTTYHTNINMEVKTNLWSVRRKTMVRSPTLTPTAYTENCLTAFNRTHFIMIGNLKNDSNIFIVEVKSMKKTYLATLPVPKILWYHGDVDEYRIGCSVMFNKSGNKELATVSRPYDPYERNDSYCYILNLNTLVWTEFNCNIGVYGNLVVMKGILYYFNVLNKYGHLGYYYDNLRAEWIELPMKGIKYTPAKKNVQIFTEWYPIVIVPYFG